MKSKRRDWARGVVVSCASWSPAVMVPRRDDCDLAWDWKSVCPIPQRAATAGDIGLAASRLDRSRTTPARLLLGSGPDPPALQILKSWLENGLCFHWQALQSCWCMPRYLRVPHVGDWTDLPPHIVHESVVDVVSDMYSRPQYLSIRFGGATPRERLVNLVDKLETSLPTSWMSSSVRWANYVDFREILPLMLHLASVKVCRNISLRLEHIWNVCNCAPDYSPCP